jgi:hypothetical protein
LAGTFFAAILIFVSQERLQKTLLAGEAFSVLSMIFLTVTFVAFAFSTFAFGLSADCCRESARAKLANIEEDQKHLEEKAKESFWTGLSFFKAGYVSMMLSLTFVLALVHPIIGLAGFLFFVFAWAYLWKKTGPYVKERH